MSSNNKLNANQTILNKLQDLAYKYPDMRFHQLLAYAEITQQIPLTNSEGQNELVIKDEFYTESSETLKRMRKE